MILIWLLQGFVFIKSIALIAIVYLLPRRIDVEKSWALAWGFLFLFVLLFYFVYVLLFDNYLSLDCSALMILNFKRVKGSLTLKSFKQNFIVNSIPVSLCSRREFITPKITADKRIGPHSFEFMQIFTGLMLGDGSLSKNGNGAVISVTVHKPLILLAKWLNDYLYDKGYVNKPLSDKGFLNREVVVKGQKVQREYLNIKSFTFSFFCTPSLMSGMKTGMEIILK